MVYLLHFDRPFGHARHYLGTRVDADAVARLNQGVYTIQTPALLVAASMAGVSFTVARVWHDGDEQRARSLRACGGRSRFCPICRVSAAERES